MTRLSLDQPENVEARGGAWRVVLITDVVSSSRVSAEVGDIAYYELIMRHHEIVRRCIARFGGREFSESGDGLLAWFGSTAAAVAAAFSVLDELEVGSFAGPQLHVKIGLAGGEPLFHDGRPYGQVVNRAARVVDLAKGGQVLCDEAVERSLPANVVGTAPALVQLRNLGEHRILQLRRRE